MYEMASYRLSRCPKDAEGPRTDHRQFGVDYLRRLYREPLLERIKIISAFRRAVKLPTKAVQGSSVRDLPALIISGLLEPENVYPYIVSSKWQRKLHPWLIQR